MRLQREEQHERIARHADLARDGEQREAREYRRGGEKNSKDLT